MTAATRLTLLRELALWLLPVPSPARSPISSRPSEPGRDRDDRRRVCALRLPLVQWRRGSQRLNKQRLVELAYVADALTEVLPAEAANLWMFTPNRVLDHDVTDDEPYRARDPPRQSESGPPTCRFDSGQYRPELAIRACRVETLVRRPGELEVCRAPGFRSTSPPPPARAEVGGGGTVVMPMTGIGSGVATRPGVQSGAQRTGPRFTQRRLCSPGCTPRCCGCTHGG